MDNLSIDNREAFIQRMLNDLQNKVKHNKLSVEKLAASFDIQSKTEVKEFTELAIVRAARAIAQGEGETKDKFQKIVSLYESQVNLSHRTSQSVLLQQYSTPAPISYLAGVYAKLDTADEYFKAFEPSAGNGLLTIAGNPSQITVNEIDDLRRSNLESQGYKQVLKQDATEPFKDFYHHFDAVITNPPFGTLDYDVKYDGFPIRTLDHLMALRALDCMRDNGRAAIIIGGHTKWDEKRRIQAGKNRIFFNYLYGHYNVEDVIQVDGQKLYSRQGTSFDVRLILINGRKEYPGGVARLKDKYIDVEISSFGELYNRVMESCQPEIWEMTSEELERKAVMYVEVFKSYPTEITDNLKIVNRLENGNEFTLTKPTVQKAKVYAVIVHEAKVTEAVERGLPVPAKVLAEYPFLQEREMNKNLLEVEAEALALELELLKLQELGAPYQPASDSCVVLDTVVPDSMAYETHEAINKIKEAVGGNIDEFVRDRLGYYSQTELCKALSAEQIDAVAMAIYNIEARAQGMIVGDQTGIGKGRVAAAIIRYGVEQGYKPVFITEKANLFSDLYRDLAAIGSAHLVPFIVNGRESKTDIKDEEGEVIYQALTPPEQNTIFQDSKIPGRYNFVMGTYSQFNSPERKPLKPAFLKEVARDNIIIMDESHNSSGSSNVGAFMQGVIRDCAGVVFLSATFAKRPDNMPIYAMKTAISEANMSKDDLVEAIIKGGVALQEVLSSQLVNEGQMLRRERSFEGVEVNYITLEDKSQEHYAIADNITDVLREIIQFQSQYIDKVVKELDDIAAAEGKEVNIREGTSQAGVDNLPYFSKVFNVINQMLFSIKAEAVAERAIARLKEGKKPVIAFASTMGSFIEDMENEAGLTVSDVVNADFGVVLQKGLDGIMRYSETLPNGAKEFKTFKVSELGEDAQFEYKQLSRKIDSISTGITISPIDVIIRKIKEAGYTVAEVTGRKYELQINPKTNTGMVKTRKRINTNDAFRQFNNNEVDVLLINQSGSTGASAHAILTPKVPKAEVKQRVMIVLQAELDINTEVQKRGRINRTGQIYKPIYDYVNSAIPAEKRLMMMLQKKLKSLDANTTSNQKQSTKILDVPDFLNKYGDKLVKEYLSENLEINKLLNDPLDLKKPDSEKNDESHNEDAAHKVSGRVAVLSTKMQQDFYSDMSDRYNNYVEYIKQIGEYDLEVEEMKLDAQTISTSVVKVGKGGHSEFGDDSIMEKVYANVLRKPFRSTELEIIINESLAGKDPNTHRTELLNEYESFMANSLAEDKADEEKHYEELIKDIPNEKKIKKLEGDQEKWLDAVKSREKELDTAKLDALKLMEKWYDNRMGYITDFLKFFKIGYCYNYPFVTYENGVEKIFSVFLGYIIDRKKKNPYAPSAIKLRFALANSNKYIALPASFTKDINSIMGVSTNMPAYSREDLLKKWEVAIKESTTDRQIRYIITGNLLQAFTEFKGKLVSYTTLNGEIKKGILMPEYYEVSKDRNENVIVVPIERALKVITSSRPDEKITTKNEVTFIKQYRGGYKVLVASSRKQGGDIFLDPDALALVTGNNFEKVANKMTAYVSEDNIAAFIKTLQKFNTSLAVTPEQFKLIESDMKKKGEGYPRLVAIKRPELMNDEATIIEMEAVALQLELELLNLAA